MTMENFLAESEIIDYFNENIRRLAKRLAEGCQDDVEIARNCFEYVRDKIRHTGDHCDSVTTCKASDVLERGTGWCYAKSHLLAALLRANGIPTGFCYQRLSCSEYQEDVYCLHGLNAVYLKEYGWYRVDARGNKDGVKALFDPPNEILAFKLEANENDVPGIFEAPHPNVLRALETNTTYELMVENFPDF